MIAARPLRRGRAEPACTAAARAVTIGHSARAVLAMESCVDVLCRSLRSCAGVRLGLLFGSHAQQRARADSDLGLAVELDLGVDARRLAADLSAAVGREVDLVVLGGAEVGYPLLKALVDHGRVLYERRPGRAAAWRAQALSALETDGPWFRRMREPWLARLRRGGAMVDRDIVAAKLAELSTRIERAGKHCPASSAALAADQDALDLVSFNLLLAVQSCLDPASHIIADEGWPPATSFAQAFRRLAEQQVLSPATAAALAQAAGPRNLVAHGYSGVDMTRVHHAATTGLADLRRFMQEVSVWLGAAPESPG